MSSPILIMGICIISDYRFNFTSSEAIGIWQISALHNTLHHGDHILVCHRVITPLLHSRCTPCLIKTVVGVPGDRISLESNGVFINQYLLPQSKPYPTKQYFPLHHLTLSANQYWVYGSHLPTLSLDSRYVGPISMTDVLAIAKPILIFPSIMDSTWKVNFKSFIQDNLVHYKNILVTLF
ncbi:MAG TPA: S26 family signal peptidase [Ferrovaceae bacterium]|nr:S26 family signal peptidase [Ferrovaceae bacterium]